MQFPERSTYRPDSYPNFEAGSAIDSILPVKALRPDSYPKWKTYLYVPQCRSVLGVGGRLGEICRPGQAGTCRHRVPVPSPF